MASFNFATARPPLLLGVPAPLHSDTGAPTPGTACHPHTTHTRAHARTRTVHADTCAHARARTHDCFRIACFCSGVSRHVNVSSLSVGLLAAPGTQQALGLRPRAELYAWELWAGVACLMWPVRGALL